MDSISLIRTPIEAELEAFKKLFDSSLSSSNALLDSVVSHIRQRNGKMMRPILVLLVARLYGAVTPATLHAAVSLELLHTASLVHDDVVDESDIRRGSKTLNKIFNNKTAILTGDYLLSIALEKLNSLTSPETISMCANTLANMCIGEVNQYFSKFKIPTLEQYLKKSEQKTAKLFQTAVCGAMQLSGKTAITEAENFSHAFGMAFQIRDDILNLTALNSLKPSQNDISEGIYNAPVIFAGNTSNLDEGIEKTKTLLNNYVVEAEKALSNLEDNKYKLALKELLGILNHV